MAQLLVPIPSRAFLAGGWSAVALLLAGPAGGQSAATPEPPAAQLRQGLDVRVLHAPTPVRVGARTRLVHELMLTNLSRAPVTLQRIEIVDMADGQAVATADATAIAILARPLSAASTIGPGEVAIAYIEADLAPGRALPHRIGHRLSSAQDGQVAVVTGGEVAPDARALPRLGAPLRGGPWAAVYEPRLANGHRRYVYATAGEAVIPGRHAIDWMAASARPGDGFGADVLAVADGVVLAARDGMPEPAPGAARPRHALSDAAGNYVALDIGGGRTAFYEHLAPGLRVTAGQRVRRGEVIARLGSTGQASRPHLHFHVATGAAPLAADGLPYVLEGARTVGSYPDIDAAARGGAWTRTPPRRLDPDEDSLPPPNSVVTFD